MKLIDPSSTLIKEYEIGSSIDGKVNTQVVTDSEIQALVTTTSSGSVCNQYGTMVVKNLGFSNNGTVESFEPHFNSKISMTSDKDIEINTESPL